MSKDLPKMYAVNFNKEINNGDIICEIISAVRGEKSNNNLSLKTIVKELNIDCSKEIKEAINKSEKDFKATLFIDKLTINDIEESYKINKIELKLPETILNQNN